MRPLSPPWIDQIAPYVPGKPIKEVEREYGVRDALKLASNENCLGSSPRAVEAVRKAVADVWLYPEGGCPYLRGALAPRLGVGPANLVFGDGSHEILEFAVRAFVEPDEEVVTSAMSFAIYKLATINVGRKFVEVPHRDMHYDLEAIAKAIGPKTKLVFLANPNNPTGTMIPRDEFEAFLAKVPADVVVVCDEAYYEFVRDPRYPDSLKYHDGKRRILTTRTFSKAYGLAGLRVGYGIARPDMVQALEKVRPAFNVNSLAQVAAEAALDDDEFLARSRKVTHEGLDLLGREIPGMGLRTWPSQTNFVMVDVGMDARAFFERMIRQGVIVRPVGPTQVRINTGTPEQNAKLLAAMRKAIEPGTAEA